VETVTGVSRFDCYPSDFLNGIVGLKADHIATYTVVMMRQYDLGEPVPYHGRELELSIRAGLPRGRLAKAIDHLLSIGKLRKTDDGRLFNGRTAEELEKICERISKNAENSQKGGEANKKRWDQIRNENNDHSEPTGYPTGNPKQSPISPPSSLPPSPIDTDPNGSVVDAGASPPVDLTFERDRKRLAEERTKLRSLGEQWNALAGELGLPQIEEIDPGSARERSALARLRERRDFDRVFAKIRASPFLRGERGSTPCSFDWITNPRNYLKIVEGNYDEVRQAQRR
jgi:hypothetical protein